ncbi:hypothetical protein RB16p140 [Escherichia phage RB16]|uniref:Conserved hypothetical phage protein n=1 Tax=Escherichia phage RB16 TaxID=2681599 RepID=D9ICK1_BPRB1|nr:hypothetical protein RB16p140 [Escherichia phage RB16]ADJ55444.1 conserved hypothetical phage protein [Escherichia phage RB16]
MRFKWILPFIFLCSFSGHAKTDPLGEFIEKLPAVQSTLPLQQATVIKKAPANAPAYVKELDEITPKQKKVLEYAFRVGNDYDLTTAKPAEKRKIETFGISFSGYRLDRISRM